MLDEAGDFTPVDEELPPVDDGVGAVYDVQCSRVRMVETGLPVDHIRFLRICPGIGTGEKSQKDSQQDNQVPLHDDSPFM